MIMHFTISWHPSRLTHGWLETVLVVKPLASLKGSGFMNTIYMLKSMGANFLIMVCTTSE
eukprot:c42580_g1_i1 orf=93-272(-)